MAAKNIGAEKTDKKWHAHLLSKLDGKLTDEEVRKLKHFLGTAETLTLNELGKCSNFCDVWNSLERARKLAIGDYDELSELMEMLKRMDCVGVIIDHKGRIEDYRAKQHLSQSQKTSVGRPSDGAVPKTTASDEKECSQSQKTPVGRPSDGAAPKTTASDEKECSQSRGKSLVKAAGDGDTASVLKLLSDGADVDYIDYEIMDKDGLTALMLASLNGHLDVVDALLKGDVEVDKEQKNGWTALMIASQKDHIGVVDALLKGGAEVDKEQKDGSTALMTVSQFGQPDVVDVLLKGGAEVDKEDKDGWTALMIASLFGQPDVVDVLLKGGAEVDKEEKDGWTALMIASRFGQPDVVDVLLKGDAEVDKEMEVIHQNFHSS
ncbi:ankyrin repeat domain-containing protein 29-like [Lineus longissimus]|uniref:ankyrin repeat domain-containing protein 29-like n=1 Tax=Lineus longissimus TaxID=88925 RepID=UPI00315C7851